MRPLWLQEWARQGEWKQKEVAAGKVCAAAPSRHGTPDTLRRRAPLCETAGRCAAGVGATR